MVAKICGCHIPDSEPNFPSLSSPSSHCAYHTSVGLALLPLSIVRFNIRTSATSLSDPMHISDMIRCYGSDPMSYPIRCTYPIRSDIRIRSDPIRISFVILSYSYNVIHSLFLYSVFLVPGFSVILYSRLCSLIRSLVINLRLCFSYPVYL